MKALKGVKKLTKSEMSLKVKVLRVNGYKLKKRNTSY